MKWLKKNNRIYVLGIIFVSILLFIPMFVNPYHINNDTLFHVANVDVLVKIINENFFGGILEKIVPLIGNNFGYGTRLFYPQLSQTLLAYLTYFFQFINIDLINSMKIFHFLVFLISGIVMFYASNRFFKNSKLSFVSAIIYLTSSYHLNEIYVRDAEAESMVFIFLPLIITAIKELLEGNRKAFYYLFVIGYVGGILSHFTLMIYFTLLLGISMLFFWKKIFKKEFIVPFLKACALVFLLTAFFFEPLFEHKFLGNYRVYQKWVMSLGIQHTALWGFEYFVPFDYDNIIFNLSIITIILLVALFKYHRKEFKNDNYKLILIFSCLSLWLSTVYFPWIIMPYTLFMIQFGWRLVTFVILGISFIAPLALKNVKKNSIFIIVIVGLIISGFLSIHYATEEIFSMDKINYVYGMGWQREYLPVKTEENADYFNNRNEDVISDNKEATIKVLENNVPNLIFEVETKDIIEVEMPRLFYFGYYLEDQDGNFYEVYENEKGFLAAKVKSGTYILTFKGSKAYQICFGISSLTLISIIVYKIYGLIRKKFKKVKNML